MKRKNIVFYIVIFITMIQCFILLSYKGESLEKNISDNESYGITEVKNAKYIKEIERDFNEYNTLTILSYNKVDNGSWRLNCKLEGTSEDILNDLENIDEYNITNYSLNYENNNILLEIDLLSK